MSTANTQTQALGAAVQSLRIATKMSADQFSVKLGISHQHFCRIERGERALTEEQYQAIRALCNTDPLSSMLPTLDLAWQSHERIRKGAKLSRANSVQKKTSDISGIFVGLKLALLTEYPTALVQQLNHKEEPILWDSALDLILRAAGTLNDPGSYSQEPTQFNLDDVIDFFRQFIEHLNHLTTARWSVSRAIPGDRGPTIVDIRGRTLKCLMGSVDLFNSRFGDRYQHSLASAPERDKWKLSRWLAVVAEVDEWRPDFDPLIASQGGPPMQVDSLQRDDFTEDMP